MQGMTVRKLSFAALAALAVTASMGGCGGEPSEPRATDEPERTQSPAPTTGAPPGADENRVKPDEQGNGDEQGGRPGEKPPRGEAGPAEGPHGDPRVTELEREAAATVRAYVSALDSRDTERVCSLLAPGVIERVKLPLPRRDCASSLEASIGYRDPRGLPIWEGAEVLEVASVKTEGPEATVVATVLTRFADRAEPSLEDDVVHLTRAPGGWLLARPSSTLYRAVGIADVPPIVLAPPREHA